jgi:Zn-dependent protease with chaperone function
MMWWWSVALVRLAWELGAGCGLVVVALLASWLGLRAVAGQLRAGRYSGPVAFHRFRLIRTQAGLLLAFSGLFFAVWSSTLAQGQDLPPPAWIAVATLSILTSLALYAVLAAWLLTPRAWVTLRGSAFRTSAYIAYVAKAVLLGYVPILLFIETAALLFVFDLAPYRWLLLPVVALWMSLVGFISPWLRIWLTGAVPLERTIWADLAPRILAWAKLAGAQVDNLRVDYIEDGNAVNAVLAGVRRRTLFLGAELLESTDWRQRDTVIGHELGHARLRHLPTNTLTDILRISLFAALILAAVDPSFAYALFPSLARDPATAPSALSVALAPLVVGGIAVASLIVSSIDRRRRHRAELDCDRFSAHLTGDPLAMAVVLHTIITLIGYPLKQRSRTHPTFSQRQQAMMQLLYQPGPRAPWAYVPVPSAVPYVDPPFTYTVPLDQAPPPAPAQAHPPMAPPPFAPVAPYPPLPPYLPVPAYAGMPLYPSYPPYAPAGVYPPVPPYAPAPAYPAAGAPAYPGMPPNTGVPPNAPYAPLLPYAPMPLYLPLPAYPPYPPYSGYPPLPLYPGVPGIPPYAPVPPYIASPAPAAPPTPPATSPEPELRPGQQ